MNTNVVTWQSLSLPLKMIIGLALASGPICSFLQSDADDKTSEKKDEVVLPAAPVIAEGPDLKCMIQNVEKAKTFTCGEYRFKVTTFKDNGADVILGGELPENKSLQSIGCQLADNKIFCREEKKIEGGRASGFLVYRSFTATYEKLATTIEK